MQGFFTAAKAVPCEASRTAFIDAVSNDTITLNTVSFNEGSTPTTITGAFSPNNIGRGAAQGVFTASSDQTRITISSSVDNETNNALASIAFGPVNSNPAGGFLASCSDRVFGSVINSANNDLGDLTSTGFVNNGNSSSVISHNVAATFTFTVATIPGQQYETTCGAITERGGASPDGAVITCNVSAEAVNGGGGETPTANRFQGTTVNFTQLNNSESLPGIQQTVIDLLNDDENDGRYPFRLVPGPINIVDGNGATVSTPEGLSTAFIPLATDRGFVGIQGGVEQAVSIPFSVNSGLIQALNLQQGTVTQEFTIRSIARGANVRGNRGNRRARIQNGVFVVQMDFDFPLFGTINCLTGDAIRITNLDTDSSQARGIPITGFTFAPFADDPSNGNHLYTPLAPQTLGGPLVEVFAAGVLRRGVGYAPADEYIAALQDENQSLANLVNVLSTAPNHQLTVANGTISNPQPAPQSRVLYELLPRLTDFVENELNVGDRAILVMNLLEDPTSPFAGEFGTYLSHPTFCSVAGTFNTNPALFDVINLNNNVSGIPIINIEKIREPRARNLRRADLVLNNGQRVQINSNATASNRANIPISIDNLDAIPSDVDSVNVSLSITGNRRFRRLVEFENGSQSITVNVPIERLDDGRIAFTPTNVAINLTDNGVARLNNGRRIDLSIRARSDQRNNFDNTRVRIRAVNN